MAAKATSHFLCSACNYKTVKWVGCCPECTQWNSLVEIKPATLSSVNAAQDIQALTLVPLNSIVNKPLQRMLTGIDEWDRVMGAGIVPGSFLILTGDPGIGKSTLLLHISNALADKKRVWYFSTEESLQQVQLRAQRLGVINDLLLFSDQAHLETIINTIVQEKPDVVIIDSIQNCHSNRTDSFPGSIGQLRESAFTLMRVAKEHTITIILSGHITKEGNIAGPKTLEHMVDGVFYLHGDDRWQTRILRSVKNRFGTIDELGFFHMNERGLEQVPNINEYIIKEVSHNPGSVLISSFEGSRPLLIELQALTIESKLTIPQRIVSGIDHKQVVLIAAILEKYLKIRLSIHDIFFKVSGGLRIKESGSDLGIALALLSSYLQIPLPERSLALGEISLTGMIKPVPQINAFVKEAEKFGISQLLVAKGQKLESSCTIRTLSSVYELIALFNDAQRSST